LLNLISFLLQDRFLPVNFKGYLLKKTVDFFFFGFGFFPFLKYVDDSFWRNRGIIIFFLFCGGRGFEGAPW
jgi:hypothetical protein